MINPVCELEVYVHEQAVVSCVSTTQSVSATVVDGVDSCRVDGVASGSRLKFPCNRNRIGISIEIPMQSRSHRDRGRIGISMESSTVVDRVDSCRVDGVDGDPDASSVQ